VIEPSAGADRATLAFLIDAYREEKVRKEKRVVLALQHRLAPIKVAVLPLLRNRPEIVEAAKSIAQDLRKQYKAVYDDTASIGRLYRRQDEIGTPFCVTVDVQSIDDRQVTVRERDSMEQVRVPMQGIVEYLTDCLNCGELINTAG
jgi:glycyl-tRNA synthetase